MDWLTELLQQTGEYGVDPSILESSAGSGGLNFGGGDLGYNWTDIDNAIQGWTADGNVSTAGNLQNYIQQAKTLAQQTGLSPSNALKLLGQLGSAGLGAYASNKQAGALNDLANQYLNMGAPYRAMLASSYADPNAFLANDPSIRASVDQGTNALARSLSVTGNPAQSGRTLQELQNYATQGLYGQLGNERNRLANFGGLSNFNAAAPTTQTQAIGQNANVYNALGYGINQITNPQPSLADIWKSINATGFA